MDEGPRAAAVALAAMLCFTAAPPAGAGAAASTSIGSAGWTVYHGDPAGSGVAAPVTSVDTSTPAWTSPSLDGQLYGEPLVFSGDVYVATENDTVYALSATNGAVIWSHHLASPVPRRRFPVATSRPPWGSPELR